MRRVTILLAALLGILYVARGEAAAPEPIHITVAGGNYQTVESQNHRVNDLVPCAFDADDRVAVAAEGVITGAYQIDTCVVIDATQHLLSLDFRTPSARPFVATLTMVNTAGTHTLSWPSVKDGKTQRVKVCSLTPRFDAETVFPPVGNNDLVGYYTDLHWKLELLGDKPARDSVMTTQLTNAHSGHQATGCGAFYTTEESWPACEGDSFTDGRVCHQ